VRWVSKGGVAGPGKAARGKAPAGSTPEAGSAGQPEMIVADWFTQTK
jgi:hypothetical protein